MRAKIAEIFSSLQGEGIFCGYRQIFLRFASCNLRPRCSYCDTLPLANAKMRGCSAALGKVRELLCLCRQVHSISLTGGEPLLYTAYLKELVPLLKNLNLRIYLETNGTLPQELKKVIHLLDIIAMDMKLPSSTGLKPFWGEHKRFLQLGCRKEIFVKTVITSQTSWPDLERAVEIIESIDVNLPLVLQPVMSREKAKGPDLALLLDFQKRVGERLAEVRIIPQTHKMIGVK